MPERLLNSKQASARFGISVRSFLRYRPKLCALGLQMVRAGKKINYRESSIDRIIKWAAEKEEPIYEINEGEDTQ